MTAIAIRGSAAALCGGALFGAFLLLIAPQSRGVSFEGFAVFAIASLAWAIGYAYLAAERPQLNRQPVISGLVYGAVVYIGMQLVLYAVALDRTETAFEIVYGLIGCCIFFGLPVAFIVRAFSR